MLYANLGGLAGHFVGRMYRNEHDYRRFYRERGNVGGFFGSILNSAEFDLFLSLLCFLIVLNVLQRHLMTAPVTSFSILLMTFAHFEKDLLGKRNTFLTAENYNAYCFHPQSILDGQWYRLVTGPLLHKRRKLHLYLNMTALVILCQVEVLSSLSTAYYALFFVGLIIGSGVMYIYCIMTYKRRGEQGLNSYRASAAGFTGVIFALKCYWNSCKTGESGLSLPLAGDLFAFSIPVMVPSFAEHFVELFLVSVLFGNEVPFWANVGGIMAGYLAVALETMLVALGVSSSWNKVTEYTYVSPGPHAFEPNKSSLVQYAVAVNQAIGNLVAYAKNNNVLVTVLFIVMCFAYKAMNDREQELRRRLDEVEHERNATKAKEETSHYDTVPREVPMKEAASSSEDQSWSLANDSALPDDPDDVRSKTLSTGESLYDECSESGFDLPSAFTLSLRALTTVTETQDKESIIEALTTLQTIITNAVTKGQKSTGDSVKYRRIRVSNPRIQKCNINGAFALLMAAGFEVREDFDDKKWLVYPKHTIPDWVPAALDAIQAKLESLVSAEPTDVGTEHDQMDELKRRMKAAALKRQEASKPKKRKPRESQFTPGLGGGNSKAVYYQGGT